MEIIQASCGDIRGRLLHPPPPLLQFQLPLFTLRRFSYSFACSHHRRFRMLLPTSVLSLTPNLLPLISFSKPLTTAYSLPDGTNSGSATKAADVDPALAVKKKASEISPELKGTSIFLVGINNALKTSLGKLLADALRYYYFDSDDLVEEAAAGESAGKSFRETDKEGFCKSETEVLKQLSSLGRLVVCTGNGAVQSATNLALLRDGLSIWIDVPLDMVARDVVEKGNQLPPSDKNSSGSYSVVFNQLTLMFEEMRVGYATADRWRPN
ncbi:probable inactive shikimate kinase like 1, chloroplastic isoform X2 [Actinidia eriantha]|uniref:probable inactive shikimate kinase like 1, chloroplastic isoform X2 n=1 Tax=Actinidia eriantha TaxID=165200 RepID=UPI00258E54D8|nr:probable inactive shikimate kinase like 1, chloroplastic isoform X2 [Actinidia eriantha]